MALYFEKWLKMAMFITLTYSPIFKSQFFQVNEMYLSDEEYSNCFEKPKKKGKRKRSPSPPPSKKEKPGKTPKGAKAKKSRQDDDEEDEVK